MSVDLPQCDPWSLKRVGGISGNGTVLLECIRTKPFVSQGITKPEAVTLSPPPDGPLQVLTAKKQLYVSVNKRLTFIPEGRRSSSGIRSACWTYILIQDIAQTHHRPISHHSYPPYHPQPSLSLNVAVSLSLTELRVSKLSYWDIATLSARLQRQTIEPSPFGPAFNASCSSMSENSSVNLSL